MLNEHGVQVDHILPNGPDLPGAWVIYLPEELALITEDNYNSALQAHNKETFLAQIRASVFEQAKLWATRTPLVNVPVQRNIGKQVSVSKSRDLVLEDSYYGREENPATES